MDNDLIEQKSGWQKNWKWLIALIGMALILIFSIFSSGFGEILGDYSKAYADPKLYEIALEKVKKNEHVIKVLGTIEPLDNMTILNGFVNYSNNNKSVSSTIKISCKKGNAMLDISADRNNDAWHYKKINVRIKNPPEKKETIEIINSTE